MSIEKNIHQTSFRNDYQKAMVNIVFTSSWIQGQVKLFLKEFDLTSQQYNILRILRGSKSPLSTFQIRDRMIDKMSDTSRLIERLIKKELVEKKISNIDKRMVEIVISEKGLTALAILDTKQAELDGIMDGLTPVEALTMNALLDKLRGE